MRYGYACPHVLAYHQTRRQRALARQRAQAHSRQLSNS